MTTIITRNANETFTQVQTREDGRILELTFRCYSVCQMLFSLTYSDYMLIIVR